MPWQPLNPGTLKNTAALMNPMPQFFMSGDGHRDPPFKWTISCEDVKNHFQTLMANGNLCAHVEQLQEHVTAESVPKWLYILFDQGLIFGWELSIYKPLESIMDRCMHLCGEVEGGTATKVTGEILTLHKDMTAVQNLMPLVGNPQEFSNVLTESNVCNKYFQELGKKSYGGFGSVNQPKPEMEKRYIQFLLGYHKAAMGLRTSGNRYIGANIQSVINKYPNHTHIISCGDAHITTDPLDRYINLPNNALGVFDADKGM